MDHGRAVSPAGTSASAATATAATATAATAPPCHAVTVLTLNCWGLKFISDLRRERLAEIGRRLALLAESEEDLLDPPSEPGPAGTESPPKTPPLSIVALQECWCLEDFAAIRDATAHVLPYSKFFRSGVWGAGLALFSRWPITDTSMHPYTLNGRPTAFWRGDWFVGKGMASATIAPAAADHAEAAPPPLIHVFNTHTHAPYEAGRPGDSYLVHRLSQSWELGKRLRAAVASTSFSPPGHPPAPPPLVLAMGDFNMTPLSLPYRVAAVASRGCLHDAWRQLHPDSSLGPAHDPAEQARLRRLQALAPTANLAAVAPGTHTLAPTAAFNLAENGATSDNVLNTWRWPKPRQKRLLQSYRQRRQRPALATATAGADVDLSAFAVPPDTPDPRGKRLDYVFYASSSPSPPPSSSSSSSASATPSCAWTATAARVALTEPHPDLGCSVSDHFAVLVTLACRSPLSTTLAYHNPLSSTTPTSSQSSSQSSSQPSSQPSSQSSSQPSSLDTPDTAAVCDDVLAAIDVYLAREARQRFWRGLHFFAALAVTAGCCVAVWFSPRAFVAFLLVLVSSLNLVAGVVDGLLALLFFPAEIRALHEFRAEVVLARAADLSRPSPTALDQLPKNLH